MNSFDFKKFEKIDRPESLQERVYSEVKVKILNGRLPPGEYVVATRLAQQLGVSRTPVHRALLQLEQEGFLGRDPIKGLYVCEVSPQDVREITQLRQILETHLLRETAGQFTREELAQMESSLRRAHEELENGEIAAFLRSNRVFHHWFDQKYGNRRMSDILSNLDEHLHRVFSLVANLDDLKASHHEHELILDAIMQGDVKTAVTVLRRHLGFAETILDRRSEARGSPESK